MSKKETKLIVGPNIKGILLQTTIDGTVASSKGIWGIIKNQPKFRPLFGLMIVVGISGFLFLVVKSCTISIG